MKFPMLKKTLLNMFQSPQTQKYPARPRAVPERFRGMIAYDPEKCIGCGMCVNLCPAQGIVKREEDDKFILEFFLGSCTFCALCADLCPAGAISFQKTFSITGRTKEEMVVSGTARIAYCSECGERILFLPQDMGQQFGLDERLIRLCPRCRRKHTAGRMKEAIEPTEY